MEAAVINLFLSHSLFLPIFFPPSVSLSISPSPLPNTHTHSHSHTRRTGCPHCICQLFAVITRFLNPLFNPVYGIFFIKLLLNWNATTMGAGLYSPSPWTLCPAAPHCNGAL